MNVKFADICFNLKNLNNPYLNNRMIKYQTSNSSKYFIETRWIDSIEFEEATLLYQFQYYNLYLKNNTIIQIQKDEITGLITGKIIYDKQGGIIYLLKSKSKEENDYLEYFLMQYIVTYFILKEKTAILMHGSSILINDKCYMFSAKSGTGKSTHTDLWTKYTNAVHINDDKNILILENEEIWCYGNP